MDYIEIKVPEGTIKPTVPLAGEDSNALAIMGRVERALKKMGNERSVIDSYLEQSTAGDYDHLLRVALAFTDQSGDDGEDYDWDDDDG